MAARTAGNFQQPLTLPILCRADFAPCVGIVAHLSPPGLDVSSRAGPMHMTPEWRTVPGMTSPSRIFIPATWPQLSTALLLALGASAQAGDILRGGGGGPTAPVRSAGGNEAGGVQAAQARANATDALARTTQAIASVQQMQLQARVLATSPNNAGAGLPNGLGTGCRADSGSDLPHGV